MQEWSNEMYPPWAHGPGYIISRDIAEFVVQGHEERYLQVSSLFYSYIVPLDLVDLILFSFYFYFLYSCFVEVKGPMCSTNFLLTGFILVIVPAFTSVI